MNKYKLLNPSPVLAELNDAIDYSVFSVLGSKGCVKYWKDIRDNLTEHQYSDYITWDNIEKFDSIHYLEAIFLLLNLPTRFLLEYKEFNLYNSPYSNDCSDDIIREVFTNTIEFQSLERSNQDWIPDDIYSESRGSKFYVLPFIEWSLEKGFVEEVTQLTESDIENNPFGKINNYKSWAKAHNTIATLVAIKLYDGRLQNNSSIINNAEFYNKLSDELVPLEEGGDAKPKQKTLINYISAYNKFNK